ncbi:MAG: hypothetical protein GEV07_11025 [Streptosporangiales bacterium]|nr:hypothetical protein [Streptosporangiales bacterium]
MDARLLLFLVVAAVVAAAGAVLHARKRARVRDERGRLFAAVQPLFTDVSVTQDDVSFPVLTGSRAGHRWRLEPIVDSLTFRKLPVLWLAVTCYAELEVRAPVSVLLRPTGNEFYSPNARYQHRLPLPDGCPEHARAAAAEPVGDVELGAVTELLDADRTKEVVLSARGLRVVRQVTEAESGPYRVGRRVDLGAPVLPAAEIAELCDVLLATVTDRQAVAR